MGCFQRGSWFNEKLLSGICIVTNGDDGLRNADEGGANRNV
jgi:hypothetical protein